MTKHKCPVCGKYDFEEEDSFDICPECGWGDDKCQESNPDLHGFNHMSLNEAKEAYKEGKKVV